MRRHRPGVQALDVEARRADGFPLTPLLEEERRTDLSTLPHHLPTKSRENSRFVAVIRGDRRRTIHKLHDAGGINKALARLQSMSWKNGAAAQGARSL